MSVIYLDPPSADPAVNRDMIAAKFLAAAQIGACVMGDGTYEVAAIPSDTRYVKILPGQWVRSITPGSLKFKFLPIGSGTPVNSSIGFFMEDPYGWTFEDVQIEGSGAEMAHCVYDSYSGTVEKTVTLYKVNATGAAFAIKIQGGKTTVRRLDCHLSGWIIPYEHTTAVNPDGTIPLDKIGGRDENLGGTSTVYIEPGYENERQHPEYINPVIKVYQGGCTYEGARLFAYQCNGTGLRGYGHAWFVDPVVPSSCAHGFQTHPTEQMQIVDPKFTPSGPVLAMNGGGVKTVRGYMRPVGHPANITYDNTSLDFNGVEFDRTDIEGDPTECFFFITHAAASGLGYVKKGGWCRQLTMDTPMGSVVHFQATPAGSLGPVGQSFTFDAGRIYIEKGHLWQWDFTGVPAQGNVYGVNSPVVVRGLVTGDSIIPSGVTAFVK